MTECSPEVPEALESVVTRALRKDRDERYQTIEQMLADIKNVRHELEIASEKGPARRRYTSRRAEITCCTPIVTILSALRSIQQTSACLGIHRRFQTLKCPRVRQDYIGLSAHVSLVASLQHPQLGPERLLDLVQQDAADHLAVEIDAGECRHSGPQQAIRVLDGQLHAKGRLIV